MLYVSKQSTLDINVAYTSDKANISDLTRTWDFAILEMHPLAAASRSRLTVRNVLLYMRSHGSALNLSLRQT